MVVLHTQTVIACIWDFDRTLIEAYSQDVLFDEFGIEGTKFWDEVNNLKDTYAERGIRVAEDTAYLGHMITYAKAGLMPGLSNEKMRELGAKIRLNPGVPEVFALTRAIPESDARFRSHGITLEHYVVSTGVRALIEGSAVGPHVDGIWANDFIEEPLPPGYREHLPEPETDSIISQVGYMIDNTSKTRAVFEINKGVNMSDQIDVNTQMAESERRVPIPNMIYVADGPSDVPVFSVVGRSGGQNLAVYSTSGSSNFAGVKSLQDQGRVKMIGPADFRPESPSYLWLDSTIREIATTIADTRDRYMQGLGGAPKHVT